MDSQTYNKLKEMKMSVMAETYMSQCSIPNIYDYTFDDRLRLMVDAEYDARINNRLKNRIKEARFPEPSARIESIDYFPDRHINKNIILDLASNNYIHKPQNILVTGATGCGKTYMVCALGNRACEDNYKVRYIRMPDLLSEFKLAKLSNSMDRLMIKFKKYDLLIIDEWLLYAVNDEERQIILEIIERKYRTNATIICSQFTKEGWHERLGGGAIADAIMDRLIPKSIEINIAGEISMRSRD